MDNKLNKENPQKQNWLSRLSERLILSARNKAEAEIDEKYKQIKSDKRSNGDNNPWYCAQEKGLKKIKEKITVSKIETSFVAGILFLIFGLGCFIGLGFIFSHLITTNDVDSVDLFLLVIIFTPFVFAEIPLLILGIFFIVISSKCFHIKKPAANILSNEESLDLMKQGKAEYFRIPFDKYTESIEDKLLDTISGIYEVIHFGEEDVGDEFWDYVKRKEEAAEEKRKENERIREEVINMKIENPDMYEYLFGDYDWDNPNKGFTIPNPIPAPIPTPQPQVVYVTKEITKEVIKEVPAKQTDTPKKHKGLYSGGINGDMTMCLNCANTTCGRVSCPGFRPKTN